MGYFNKKEIALNSLLALLVGKYCEQEQELFVESVLGIYN